MIDSLVARARFYDFTGYWIPGNLAIGIAWVYAWVFGWESQANKAIEFVSAHWVAATILIFIVGGYAVGHLVNALSKLLLEKCILKRAFDENKDWLTRIKSNKTGKGAAVLKRFNEVIKYDPQSSSAAGSVIQGWAEQCLPAPSMTTFRFLCFYGMNRTLSVLTIFLIPPVAHWVLDHSHFCCMLFVIVVGFCVSLLFGFQYLRFVKLYADSLPELLLMKDTGD